MIIPVIFHTRFFGHDHFFETFPERYVYASVVARKTVILMDLMDGRLLMGFQLYIYAHTKLRTLITVPYKRRTFPIIICAKLYVSYDSGKLNVAPERRPWLHYNDIEA